MSSDGRVRVLPEALANQIAAGEVVERPASVVKELVENALDAGAERILIDIEDAGRGLLRVVDDGLGMSPDDAALAVLRHATSKLRSVEGLDAIGTLGFRGEALPSIASVSRFTLVTRRSEDEAATQLRIDGGAAATQGIASAPVGTRIEVRDLFWNVPARLKFLKSNQTETQHVVELVKAFALGYPHVHFRLGTGARSALDLPAVRRLFERVTQVLGKEAAQNLYEVSLEASAADERAMRVTGFVSSAREAKATQSGLITFVNGRRVRDRTMAHAVVSAFGSELGPGRFPQGVLWLHLDPAEVDVNVHPAKAEVRFRQPQVVHDAVVRAIQALLVKRPWLGERPLPLIERPMPLIERPDAAPARAPRELFRVEERRPDPAPHRTELRFQPTPVVRTPTPPPVPSAPRTGWRLLGRTRGALVLEGPAGIAIADGERLFEGLTLAALDALSRPFTAQPLLLPARLDLSPLEAQRLSSRADGLAQLGVQLEPFGGTTWQLLALPLPAIQASPQLVLAELAALARCADDAVLAMLARLSARAAAARGFDERQLALLVDFAASALADKRRGVFLLGADELARRLGG